MTPGDILIDYLQNGQKKQIKLSKVDQKYYPPREPGANVNVVMDSAYINHLITYIGNKMTAELNSEYERKQREEELKLMEERQKKDREASEKRRRAAAEDEQNFYALQNFAYGKHQCPFCLAGCVTLTCMKSCQAPARFNVVNAMNQAARLIQENQELREEVAALKQHGKIDDIAPAELSLSDKIDTNTEVATTRAKAKAKNNKSSN